MSFAFTEACGEADPVELDKIERLVTEELSRRTPDIGRAESLTFEASSPYRRQHQTHLHLTFFEKHKDFAMIHVGRTVKEFRETLRLTQHEMAAVLGVTNVHLSNIENNKSFRPKI